MSEQFGSFNGSHRIKSGAGLLHGNRDDERKRVAQFTYAKAIAYFDGKWRDCPHRECKRRKICTGGPRGTLRKKGKPLCETVDNAETKLRTE